MRASQRERERKEREREREYAHTHMRVYAPGLAAPSVCRVCYNTAYPSSSLQRNRRRWPSRSLPPFPFPPSTCPSTVGSPVLSVSRSSTILSPLLLRLPLAVYLSRSLPFSTSRPSCGACRICGPRSVRPRAQICARRPHDDRERGFGWI